MTVSSQLKPMGILRRYAVSAAMVCMFASAGTASAQTALPEREGPPVRTTTGVPHVQIDVQKVPQAHAELMRRVALLPSTDLRPTVVSLPGATGFWLTESIRLKRPEVIAGGREFAHIHPDGSLHASLPPDRARAAVAAGWAVRHPWADKRDGWEGFVMLFTPQSLAEADVIFRLIVDGYNYVTGSDLLADELG